MAVRMRPRSDEGSLNAFMQYAHEVSRGEHSERVAANLAALQDRIARYEAHYAMSSEEARRRLHAGSLEETFDVLRWMLDAQTLRRATGQE